MRSLRMAALGLVATAITGAFCVSPAVAQEKDRWANAMKAFGEQDKKSPFPEGGVVFVGSSSIRLWDLAKSFPQIKPVPLNRGFGGSQIADTNRHLDLLVLKHSPKTVVMYAGDNDIAAGKSPERVWKDFQEFASQVRKALPETRIAFVAIKPSVSRWKLASKNRRANELIQKACAADKHLTFIDIWKPMLGKDGRPRAELLRKDGLHLTKAGYEIWNKAVRAHLIASPANSVKNKRPVLRSP